MFKFLSKEISGLLDKIRSHGTIREEHIENFVQELKNILLASDTSLEVVDEFILSIREKTQDLKIIKSISPSEMLSKVVYNEMVKFLSLGNFSTDIKISNKIPNNILVLGLQGSGKTTASSKIGLKFKISGKKVLLVSLDTHRAAAQEQLKILADSKSIDSLEIIHNQTPIEIAHRAHHFAQKHGYEIVIYDTAGRMHIDQDMILESVNLKNFLNPVESILVIDSMLGQESVNIARVFNEKLSIDSFIISRTDGDSKGGAIFSVKFATNKPIKFLSSGENLEDLEVFDPKSIASRILNMGDLDELVRKIESLSEKQSKESQKSKFERVKSGEFNLNDYLNEIQNINKIGGFSKMLSMIPKIGGIKKIDEDKVNSEKENFDKYKAIILSMTPLERNYPQILNVSRKKRIAGGSGVSLSQVEKLLKKFNKMKIMMKKISQSSQR